MTCSLVQALHLSAQPSTQDLDIVMKLFHLDLPVRKLVLQAPVLQTQLLNHCGEVGNGGSFSNSVALWFWW